VSAARISVLLIGLAACDPLEDTGDEECFSVWSESVTADVLAEAEVPGGLFLTVAETAGLRGATDVTGAALSLWVTHLGETDDCGVAVYVSDVEADPAALPVIEPSTSPPASIAGLGDRVASARLARAAADLPDQERFEVEVPVSSRSFVTVAGCPGAELSVRAEVVVDVCTDDWEAVPFDPSVVSQVE
jgi:hypothetical protein